MCDTVYLKKIEVTDTWLQSHLEKAFIEGRDYAETLEHIDRCDARQYAEKILKEVQNGR